MKHLHNNSGGGKAAKCPRVDHLRELLGKDVLMLAWPLGTKGTKKPWGLLTVEKMKEPVYLETLDAGNIGVALGSKSNGLCTIDLDTDELMEQFLKINPALRNSLRTRGARGGNVWVRIVGEYPKTFYLKDSTCTERDDHVGEWRATGAQTIISGRHPRGCNYSFVVEGKPIEIEYRRIIWPAGLRGAGLLVEKNEEALPIEHSNTATQATQATQRTQAGKSASAVFAVSTVFDTLDVLPFVPDERGKSDQILWKMAGRLKTAEAQSQRAATSAEKLAIFKKWWALAKDHVDPAFDVHAYRAKWVAACERRKYSDDIVTAAWRAAMDQPLPPEVTLERDDPMQPKMQQLVALCWQLQLINGSEPFFLGSRDAGRLLEMPHTTVYLWLEALSSESGDLHILRKISTGSMATRHTNEWRYLQNMDF